MLPQHGGNDGDQDRDDGHRRGLPDRRARFELLRARERENGAADDQHAERVAERPAPQQLEPRCEQLAEDRNAGGRDEAADERRDDDGARDELHQADARAAAPRRPHQEQARADDGLDGVGGGEDQAEIEGNVVREVDDELDRDDDRNPERPQPAVGEHHDREGDSRGREERGTGLRRLQEPERQQGADRVQRAQEERGEQHAARRRLDDRPAGPEGPVSRFGCWRGRWWRGRR